MNFEGVKLKTHQKSEIIPKILIICMNFRCFLQTNPLWFVVTGSVGKIKDGIEELVGRSRWLCGGKCCG